MNKTVNTPAAKAAAAAAPKVEKAVEPATQAPVTAKPATPAPVTIEAPAAAVEPKKIDLNKPSIKDAIAKGKALIKDGKSKADAAMEIFTALKDEEKDVVIAAFIQGATLTEKGAVTYWYNCRRKAKKSTKQD
jgi:heme-binding NEAT domain protein